MNTTTTTTDNNHMNTNNHTNDNRRVDRTRRTGASDEDAAAVPLPPCLSLSLSHAGSDFRELNVICN